MTIAIRTFVSGERIEARAHWTLPTGQVVERRAHVRFPEQVGAEEIGRIGPKLLALGRRAARSKVLRGIARTALGIAKLTPYGAVASAAVKTARGAVDAARRLKEASVEDLRELRPPRPSPRLPPERDTTNELEGPFASPEVTRAIIEAWLLEHDESDHDLNLEEDFR